MRRRKKRWHSSSALELLNKQINILFSYQEGNNSALRLRGRWRCTPRQYLFDEPTSALDPEMINEVLDVILQLAGEGMTMIVVTHEMGFARLAADRIVFFMADGQIIESATPSEFFDAPKTERAKDFLSKILSTRSERKL